MPKRFTATEKWIDPWFCNLIPIEKLFWIYLVDNCDHAGIWNVNWSLVNFHLGIPNIDKGKFSGRIVELSDEKWFLPSFIEYQYNGELNPDNRTHASVIDILQKEGASKGLLSPWLGCKDKGKVQVQTEGGYGGKRKKVEYSELFESIWKDYPNKTDKSLAQEAFVKQVKTDRDAEDIVTALANYKLHLSVNTWKQAKDGKTWFRRWKDWLDYKEPEVNIVNAKATSPPAIKRAGSLSTTREVLDKMKQWEKEQHEEEQGEAVTD